MDVAFAVFKLSKGMCILSLGIFLKNVSVKVLQTSPVLSTRQTSCLKKVRKKFTSSALRKKVPKLYISTPPGEETVAPHEPEKQNKGRAPTYQRTNEVGRRSDRPFGNYRDFNFSRFWRLTPKGRGGGRPKSID